MNKIIVKSHINKKWTYKIHTFGCKVNTYDTSLLEGQFKDSYFSPSQDPDVHIFNTCAVTHEAIKKAQKQIRKIKLKNPDVKVVVTGCGAQVDTDQFSHFNKVDLVVANSHKGKLKEHLSSLMEGRMPQRVLKSNIFKKTDMEFGGGLVSGRTRAFLKIQDGCNSFCTYCVIPFARGKSRSLSVDMLCEKIRQFHSEGIQEVALTGVHIGDYRYQDSYGKIFLLEHLLQTILERTSIPRIRLTSLEPLELTDHLMELYKDPRMCPHFHMSIQSASANTLNRMRRKYTDTDVQKALLMIEKKVPQAFVGMDVIVGFTGESKEDFHKTYTNLKNLPWHFIHVFPYSQRPGTRASKWADDVSFTDKKMRSQELRDLSQKRYLEQALKQVGSQKKVLALKEQKGFQKLSFQKLLSRDYWKCVLLEEELDSAYQNKEFEVQVTGHQISSGNIFLKSRLLIS